jgi:chromosomal replication initiator protein
MEGAMRDISRRGLLGVLAGIGGVAAAPAAIASSVLVGAAAAGESLGEPAFSWARVELLKRGLIGEIGEDRYDSWFAAMKVEKYEHGVLFVSVPVAFLKKWIDAHYMDKLVRAAQRVDGKIGEVRVMVRKPSATTV